MIFDVAAHMREFGCPGVVSVAVIDGTPAVFCALCDAMSCADENLDPVEPDPAMVERLREYYRLPGNEAGGSLHIVLDDHNLQAHHVAYCVEYAQTQGDAIGERLGLALLALSDAERAAVVLARRR